MILHPRRCLINRRAAIYPKCLHAEVYTMKSIQITFFVALVITLTGCGSTTASRTTSGAAAGAATGAAIGSLSANAGKGAAIGAAAGALGGYVVDQNEKEKERRRGY
jgi:hypothetical protein